MSADPTRGFQSAIQRGVQAVLGVTADRGTDEVAYGPGAEPGDCAECGHTRAQHNEERSEGTHGCSLCECPGWTNQADFERSSAKTAEQTSWGNVVSCSRCGKNKVEGKACQHCGAGGGAQHGYGASKTAASPDWLHERVNDPYGTPNKHPFWQSQPFDQVGVHKVFERDGTWYTYDTQYNAWRRADDEADARSFAEGYPKGMDVWSSKTASWIDGARRAAGGAFQMSRPDGTITPPSEGDWTDDEINPGSDSIVLDMTTASMLVQVYEALSPANQAKFDAMPLTKAVDIGWKLVSKTSAKTAAEPTKKQNPSVLPWKRDSDNDGESDLVEWLDEKRHQRSSAFRATIQASLQANKDSSHGAKVSSTRTGGQPGGTSTVARTDNIHTAAQKCFHCSRPIKADRDSGNTIGTTFTHTDTNQQWGPEDEKDHPGTYPTPGTGHHATPKSHMGSKVAMPNPVDLGVKVGDIFYSSWGYDQTNIDFFEVTALTGASVKVRQVASRILEGLHGPQEKVVPDKGNYTSGEMTKRIQGSADSGNDRPGFKVNSVAYAFKWDGTPKYQTGYAYGH